MGKRRTHPPGSVYARMEGPGGPASFLEDSSRDMGDTTIKKIQSANSPQGAQGQKYLASGVGLAMRVWEDRPPDKEAQPHRNAYETVGYVIRGRAHLHSEGQSITLEPGDSWLIPRDAEHHYEILEPFTAVEATHPPARAHSRDE